MPTITDDRALALEITNSYTMFTLVLGNLSYKTIPPR
jgi:hypothetical protein